MSSPVIFDFQLYPGYSAYGSYPPDALTFTARGNPMSTLASITKDPDEIIPVQIDWSERLGTADVIASSAWDVPAGITLDEDVNDTTSATAVFSGGTYNDVYFIQNAIVTDDGYTYVDSISIHILNR